MKNTPAFRILATSICIAATSILATAAAPDGSLFDPDRAWLERYDPKLIFSRYFGEFIYESYDESDLWKLENNMLWGAPLQDGRAISVQFMLPLKWRETATEGAFGLGDLELRAGVVGCLSPSLRWAYNANITLGINVEYNITPLDEDISDVSALEVKFPVAFRINEDWSTILSYNPRWDLLAESDRHRLELGTTYVWGQHNQYA